LATKEFKPFVPAETEMKEFTLKALLLGLILAVILGAANAYLGLKAGMTIAATYPAAVIGMAVLKLFKGTVLEENFVRTVGSIGESIAAGAIFTIPAFFIAGIWPEFFTVGNFLTSTAIMIVGGWYSGNYVRRPAASGNGRRRRAALSGIPGRRRDT